MRRHAGEHGFCDRVRLCRLDDPPPPGQPDLAGLIVSAGALKVNVSFLKVGGTRAMAALFPNAAVFNLNVDEFSRDPSVVQECKNDPLVYQDAAPARTAKELLNAINRIEEKGNAVNVPLLALHGGADEVTVPDGSKALVDKAGTKDKTLKVYPKLVHDLLMKRLLDGQFEESGLTLTELHVIEASIAKGLIALYHSRIKYPEAPERKAS